MSLKRIRSYLQHWISPRLLAPPRISSAWQYRWLYAVRVRDAERAKSEFKIGAGAGIRTLDHRFKSSPRTPQDASSSLLLNSILRVSPPRGSSSVLGLAIQ